MWRNCWGGLGGRRKKNDGEAWDKCGFGKDLGGVGKVKMLGVVWVGKKGNCCIVVLWWPLPLWKWEGVIVV